MKSLSNICLVLLTILVISVLVIIITATDENQSIISIPDSFASVSDRDVTNKSVFLKASNLQSSSSSSSQQDSTVNNSTLGKINSNSSISYSSISSTPTLPQIIDPNLTVEVVADGLNMPTTMAFLGKDDFLILQKNGSLVRIVDGILSDKTRLDVPVAKGFYQGLLGIAVTNQSTLTNNNGNYVFLYYTEVTNNNTTNSKVKLTITNVNSTHILGNMVYRYEFIDDKLINPKLLLNLPCQFNRESRGIYHYWTR